MEAPIAALDALYEPSLTAAAICWTRAERSSDNRFRVVDGPDSDMRSPAPVASCLRTPPSPLAECATELAWLVSASFVDPESSCSLMRVQLPFLDAKDATDL